MVVYLEKIVVNSMSPKIAIITPLLVQIDQLILLPFLHSISFPFFPQTILSLVATPPLSPLLFFLDTYDLLFLSLALGFIFGALCVQDLMFFLHFFERKNIY